MTQYTIDKPTVEIIDEKQNEIIIKLTKPAFINGTYFDRWEVQTNAGIINIENDILISTVPSYVNSNVILKIQAIDNNGVSSDTTVVVWHFSKSGPCIFKAGKWNSCTPYVYTNNTWVKSKAILYTKLDIYYITYNLDGGTLPDKAPISYKSDIGVTLPTPTKDGYKFIGWYESSDFSGSAVTSISAGTVGSKIYYAKWGIPEGATYTLKSDGTVLTAGMPFPETVTTGDIYTYGDYEYHYNEDFGNGSWGEDTSINGWGVRVIDDTKTEYGEILNSINNVPVTSLAGTFGMCRNLVHAPKIPSNIVDMTLTFFACYNLTGEIEINATPTSYDNCFAETEGQIKIVGTTTMKVELAATANNGNVTY